jgi:hypothetical protein
MRKFPVVLAFMLLVGGPSVLRAALLIDYSPDTTGAEVLYTNLTNSLVNPAIFAGRFTLDEEAFITGGAIFSYNSYGVVGTAVWFLIYADEEPEPVVSILTELDVVDDTDATTAEWLNRKHASIPATYLPAGTYWFGLPANTDPNFVQGTGSFGDNEIRKS